MKKRLTAILLSLCLVLTLLPVAAFAADGDTVYVGGIALTGSADAPVYALTDDTGAVTTAGASADNYNIAWDGSTLTLDNATVTQGAHEFEDGAAAAIYCETDLTIELVGESHVRGSDNESGNAYVSSYGIYINNAEIFISGDGSLNAAGGTVEASVNAKSMGVYAHRVTVSAGTVTAKGGAAAVTGGYGYTYSNGIYTYDAVIIEGGNVTAAGGEATAMGHACMVYSCGIFSNNGNVSIRGGKVTAADGKAAATNEYSLIYSYGVCADNGYVSIEGGEVTATGDSEAVSHARYAVVNPQTGEGIEVHTGGTAETASEISGSPFAAETEITDLVAGEKYFHSVVVQLNDIICVGGVVLAGKADTTVYALTDDTGAVTTAGASADNYNIAWDGSTLTLNNATVTQGAHEFEDGAAAAIYFETDLTIEPVGTNTVIGPNGDDANGIGASFGVFVGGSLTVSGDGALDISGGTVEASAYTESTGIYAYRVTVSAGTVTAKGGAAAATGEYGDAYSSGIYTYDGVIIEGGTVTATGGTVNTAKKANSAGIRAYDSIVIEGGNVNAAGGEATSTNETSMVYSKGIDSTGVTVTGGTVTATGGAATAQNAESYGIDGDDAVIIRSGAVNAAGGEATSTGEGGYAYSGGIYPDSITVTGGTVTAAGGLAVADSSDAYSYGIEIYGDIILSGGNVAAVGYTDGLYCEGNVIVRPENTEISIKTLDDCIFHADTLTPDWETMDADATQIDGSPFTEETTIAGTLTEGKQYFSATATALAQAGPVVAKSRAQVKMTVTSETTVAEDFMFRVISQITDADWDAYFANTAAGGGTNAIQRLGFVAYRGTDGFDMETAQAVAQGTAMEGYEVAWTNYIQKTSDTADAYFGARLEITSEATRSDVTYVGVVEYLDADGRTAYAFYDAAEQAPLHTNYDTIAADYLAAYLFTG